MPVLVAYRNRNQMPGGYQTNRFQYHHEKAKTVPIPTTLFLLIPIRSTDTAFRQEAENSHIAGKRRTGVAGYRNRFARTLGGKTGSIYTACEHMPV